MNKFLYKINISGSVQGVGFRWNAAREARSRGITGFVKNMPDGSVYIEAEGYKNQLEDYLKWCRRGPAFANVDSVKHEAAEPEGYTEFNIEH